MQLNEIDLNHISRVNDSKNCPNCGAPIETDKCPYCGTAFIDFACLDADKPFYMKVKKGENVFILKVALTSTEMRSECLNLNMGRLDNVKYLGYLQSNQELTMTFDILPK